jgi:hypothetical protein
MGCKKSFKKMSISEASVPPAGNSSLFRHYVSLASPKKGPTGK